MELTKAPKFSFSTLNHECCKTSIVVLKDHILGEAKVFCISPKGEQLNDILLNLVEVVHFVLDSIFRDTSIDRVAVVIPYVGDERDKHIEQIILSKLHMLKTPFRDCVAYTIDRDCFDAYLTQPAGI